MEQIILQAEERSVIGKEKCKKIRRDNFIPAIVYGKDIKSKNVQVNGKDFNKILTTQSGRNVIINLKIKTKSKEDDYTVMIADLQRDVFQKSILHVDFHKISLQDKVIVAVPIKLTGEAAGTKEGGMLDQVLWEIEVESFPLNIPKQIEANVSHLNIGDNIFVKELVPPENVVIKANPEDIVAVVHAPRAEEVPVVAAVPEGEEAAAAAVATTAAVPAPGAAKAEPEVIKKGKEVSPEEES